MALIHVSSTLGEGTSENFTITFQNSIQLSRDKKHEVALVEGQMWYSWNNISQAQNNTDWRYYNGAVWRAVDTIPDGIYSLNQLNTYIKGIITANGDDPANIEISANFSTLRALITLAGGYQLDLGQSQLNTLLGFASGVVVATASGINPVDITNGIDAVQVHCSWVDSNFSYNSSKRSDVLYSFVPQSGPGTALTLRPYGVPLYLPIISTDLNNIRVRITDQNNNTLPLNSQPTSFTFYLRTIENEL